MLNTKTLLAGVAAIATGAAIATAALAQPAAPAPAKPAMAGHGMAGHGMKGPEAGRDHAAHLRAILQLRPNQEAALTAFLAAMKPDHGRMMKMAHAERPKTTPERLAAMESRMAEHHAQMRTRIEATRRFYDQLDAAQKRAFDELPPMMGHGKGMRRMHETHKGAGAMGGHAGHGESAHEKGKPGV